MAGKRRALLSMPVDEAVACIARAHLDAAARGLAKLKRQGDVKALHAFRVAIRRLRSLLSAYRPWLGKVAGRKVRRSLRDLTRATNDARDSDVALAWLASVRSQLAREDRAGVDWFRRRLVASRRSAQRGTSAKLRSDFTDAARRVRKRLNSGQAQRSPGYAAAFLELLDAEVAALCARFSAIAAANDEAAVHKARIQVKRLRYLVEPLRNELDEARAAVRPLKKFQTVLGELHDRNVLEAALGTALDDAAAEKAHRLHRLAVGGRARTAVADARRPDEAIGLVVLAARARDERQSLFGDFRRRLAASGNPVLASELNALRAAAASASQAARPRSKAGR